jgi:hypothetical protein
MQLSLPVPRTLSLEPLLSPLKADASVRLLSVASLVLLLRQHGLK